MTTCLGLFLFPWGLMKHLIVLCLMLVAASICQATSTITFSGGDYEISVLLSDVDCKVAGLNVTGESQSIISIGANELTAFSKAECDCKKETIHLVVPGTKSHPYFELKSNNKSGHMTLGKEKVNVLPDWLR
jgi:hypothetical protein